MSQSYLFIPPWVTTPQRSRYRCSNSKETSRSHILQASPVLWFSWVYALSHCGVRGTQSQHLRFNGGGVSAGPIVLRARIVVRRSRSTARSLRRAKEPCRNGDRTPNQYDFPVPHPGLSTSYSSSCSVLTEVAIFRQSGYIWTPCGGQFFLKPLTLRDGIY